MRVMACALRELTILVIESNSPSHGLGHGFQFLHQVLEISGS